MSETAQQPDRVLVTLRALLQFALVSGLGYLMVTYLSLDRGFIYAALLLAFFSCDRVLWPRSSR
jgi:hypothetical protein